MDFDIYFVVEELQDDDRDALRENLMEWVSKLRVTLDGPIKGDIDEAISSEKISDPQTGEKRKAQMELKL